MGNARNDPRDVRYARVPGGGETCDFCIMLASRGFVYTSAASAGELNHYHAHCRCRIVPSFGRESIEGYDPDYYYKLYREQEEVKGERSKDSKRAFANSLRQPPSRTITKDEKAEIISIASEIGIPSEMLSFNTGSQTSYSEVDGLIHVRGDVFPDLSSTENRDRISIAGVLAHEYYGHHAFPYSSYEPGYWADEFRASYRAAIDTPNLSDEDRKALMIDAYQRASDAGVPVRYNSKYRSLVYGY